MFFRYDHVKDWIQIKMAFVDATFYPGNGYPVSMYFDRSYHEVVVPDSIPHRNLVKRDLQCKQDLMPSTLFQAGSTSMRRSRTPVFDGLGQ